MGVNRWASDERDDSYEPEKMPWHNRKRERESRKELESMTLEHAYTLKLEIKQQLADCIRLGKKEWAESLRGRLLSIDKVIANKGGEVPELGIAARPKRSTLADAVNGEW